MGTRERKMGPSEAIPRQLSTGMDNQKLWDVAERLQRLIVSHDRAVQQMYLLDSKLQDMKNRLFHKRNSPRFLQLRQHWHSRLGMVEWMRDMYDEYRLRKWTEIQDLINNIFATYSSEEVMTVLILAEVSSQSIGIFIENEEEGETSVTSESDVSQVEEVMMVEGGSEEGQGT